jgi:SAM-dependent methyltransferase
LPRSQPSRRQRHRNNRGGTTIGTHRNDSRLLQSRKALKKTLRRFGLFRPSRKFVSSADAARFRQRLAEVLWRDFRLTMHPLQAEPSVLPPRAVVARVQGSNTADANSFFGAAYRDMVNYLDALRTHGFDVARMERMLDFGVGTGRMLLHFLPFPIQRYAVDVNPAAVEWTSQRLGRFASVQLSSLDPPLPYESGLFDLVMANSVFTHMPFDAQPRWIAELARALKPGGCALITVHDFSKLPAEHHGAGWYERGTSRGLHINTYLSAERLAELWTPAFELLEVRRYPPRQAFIVARRRSQDSGRART